MTNHPDDRTPEEPGGSDGAQPGPRLDEDAAWAEIVANYGERPEVLDDERSDLSGPAPEPGDTARPSSPQEPPAETDPFDRSYLDAQLARQSRETPELDSQAGWDDEGHFVPPTPPPLPALEPRRKAAWLALFGSPALMLLGVVLGWTYPGWISFLLVLAFVGGFGYLVATMPRGNDRGWPGDDGAVV
jgi:hypothetical protein